MAAACLSNYGVLSAHVHVLIVDDIVCGSGALGPNSVHDSKEHMGMQRFHR